MTAREFLPGQIDFPTLIAQAEPFGPRQPSRRLDVPPAGRSFAFQLDGDLVKLVSLDRAGDALEVTVTYATEVVLDRERTSIRMEDAPALSADPLGVVVEWNQPLLDCLGWLRIRRRRRF